MYSRLHILLLTCHILPIYISTSKVIAVGPGARSPEGKVFPVNVNVGDKVLLPEYGGTEVKIGDDELFVFKEFELLGKFE